MTLSTRTTKELQKVGNYRIFEAICEVGELGEKLLYFQRAGKLEIILREPGSSFLFQGESFDLTPLPSTLVKMSYLIKCVPSKQY